MKNLYFLIENYWFKLPQQLRFVLLGGFNTLLSYLIFVFLIKIAAFSYQFSLIAQYLITVNISIFSMRYYVFRSTHSLKTEYSKAWSVYLLMLALNYLFLYITIDRFQLNILLSQAVYTILSTAITYILHRFYSFRK